MFLTKKVILFMLWLPASAAILPAAPSLPAPAPVIPEAVSAAAADTAAPVALDPSVGHAGQQSATDAGTSGPSVRAVTPAAATEPAVGGADTTTYLLARTMGGLGLVIGLIVLTYVAVRRYGPKYLRRQGAQSVLKVIETLPMGEKRSIALIQVEDKRLLVGNTPQQITLLTQLPAGFETSAEADRESSTNSNPGSVTSFRRLYEVEKNQQPPVHQARAIPQDLREKMRQLREAFER
jgi:flagellar protein FliO/FliZ